LSNPPKAKKLLEACSCGRKLAFALLIVPTENAVVLADFAAKLELSRPARKLLRLAHSTYENRKFRGTLKEISVEIEAKLKVFQKQNSLTEKARLKISPPLKCGEL
jgi:hypothetical protein